MAFEGVAGGAPPRALAPTREHPSWPVACVQRPTNATSFVAVEGLGYMPVRPPRDGDRGDVKEEVFIGEIMREETREMFARLRVEAAVKAGRIAAEEHVRWMRSVGTAKRAGNANADRNVEYGSTERRGGVDGARGRTSETRSASESSIDAESDDEMSSRRSSIPG